ncbi:hypothetical protein THC_1551 [Caldimicrobium thiodismutans]|uniref:O-antigen ligase-related domain-containing protein n=1 Tax=Caldimicrobium thiodismutans TaxID=1653476 RepID=A0A0U5AJ17_9BACT|nr:O-antigen ligase family protein [Caldimicrobium thiodismutans]BAU23916.1 hypothetical protein THC_1551 [Caldimicrobium thiodismutans]
MAEEIKKLDKILKSFFYFGWTLLLISIFFKHTKTLWWIGNSLIFLFIFVFFLLNKEIFKFFYKLRELKNLLIILAIFLFLLLLFSLFISLNRIYSIEAFITNYFFNIIVFLSLVCLICFYKNNNIILILFILISFVYVMFVMYLLMFFGNLCELNLSCYVLSISNEIFEDAILQKPLTILPSAYLLCFSVFLIGFITERGKLKYLFLVLFSIAFLIILWFNRRAILLGIFLSLIFFIFNAQSKYIKKFVLFLTGLFFILAFLIFNNPLLKNMFLGRDNLSILISKNYEDFPQSGSLGIRLYTWPIYIKYLIKNPVKGTGIGRKVQKIAIEKENLDPLGIGNPHNTFLNIWMQAGIQTLIVFLLLYFMTLKRALELFSSRIFPYDRFGIGLVVFFIACFVYMNFFGMEEGTRFAPFWIASGLTWGLWTKLKLSNWV